ncbi:MAG: trypsin-like peptidase domain-containing protein [Flavobacteriales bacterium]|nr:trypsin-like peptidase domain-containing protein [Flavobacteriales bacterium]
MKPVVQSLILLLFLNSAQAQIVVRDPQSGRTFSIGTQIKREYESQNYTRPAERLSKTAIVAINKPATLKVHTEFKLSYRYQEPSFFSRIMLQIRTDAEAAQGRIPNTPEAKFEYALKSLRDQPGNHFKPAMFVKEGALQVGQTGSGMFITPNGHILTNAHVVELLPEQARLIVVQNVSRQEVINELQRYADYFGVQSLNQELLNETTIVLMQAMANFVQPTYINAEYYVETGHTIENSEYRLPATLITKGNTIPGKDVAILKAQIINAPTVALGKASELEIGDDLYLLGYPGEIDQNKELLQTVMEEPTFASGTASSWQTVTEGWRALGFDGNATKGNSGGPVFNKYGEVIGMLTFGSVDILAKNTLKQGFNFVVPSDIIGEFIAKANVTPSIGAADQIYREGIALYQAEDFANALEKFNSVQTMQPDWPYLQGYISKCNRGVAYQPAVLQREKGVVGTVKYWFRMLDNAGIRWYTVGIFLVVTIGGIIRLFKR